MSIHLIRYQEDLKTYPKWNLQILNQYQFLIYYIIVFEHWHFLNISEMFLISSNFNA